MNTMNNQDKKKNLQVCFTSIATSDAIAFDDLSIFATIKFFHSTIISHVEKSTCLASIGKGNFRKSYSY